MTVSLGVVAIPPNRSADVQGLIALADAAMYAAKHAGRDRVALASQLALPAYTAAGASAVTDDADPDTAWHA